MTDDRKNGSVDVLSDACAMTNILGAAALIDGQWLNCSGFAILYESEESPSGKKNILRLVRNRDEAWISQFPRPYEPMPCTAMCLEHHWSEKFLEGSIEPSCPECEARA